MTLLCCFIAGVWGVLCCGFSCVVFYSIAIGWMLFFLKKLMMLTKLGIHHVEERQDKNILIKHHLL